MNCNQNTVNLEVASEEHSKLFSDCSKELQQILPCQAKKGHCPTPSKYDYIHFRILQCTTHCCNAHKHVMDVHKVLLL